MTIAVGLIIHGDQAEQILQHGQADLIAVGREILNNPNWPMDAALKSGIEAPFRHVPPQFGYWLATRAKRGFGTTPSSWNQVFGRQLCRSALKKPERYCDLPVSTLSGAIQAR
jgi:tRNA-dihydrouridine synthase